MIIYNKMTKLFTINRMFNKIKVSLCVSCYIIRSSHSQTLTSAKD